MVVFSLETRAIIDTFTMVDIMLECNRYLSTRKGTSTLLYQNPHTGMRSVKNKARLALKFWQDGFCGFASYYQNFVFTIVSKETVIGIFVLG